MVEFRVYSKQRRAYFWRKVEFTDNQWRSVELPLRFFRSSSGAAVAWSEVHRLGIAFRNPGVLAIDQLKLVPAAGDYPAYLTAAELGKMAFGAAAWAPQETGTENEPCHRTRRRSQPIPPAPPRRQQRREDRRG